MFVYVNWPSVCSGGQLYSLTGGPVCDCDANCIFYSDPGCYCAISEYKNPDGVCSPATGCTSEWECIKNLKNEWSNHIIPTVCQNGKVYFPGGGTTCTCDTSGTVQCPAAGGPGCYCPVDMHQNAGGSCAPDSECQRKWIDLSYGPTKTAVSSFLLFFPHFIPASCTGGKQYFLAGGQECSCVSGSVDCNINFDPGCYCLIDEYADAQGVCTSKDQCQREWNDILHIHTVTSDILNVDGFFCFTSFEQLVRAVG